MEFKTVNDFFNWKLKKSESSSSVEQINRNTTNLLKWGRDTDVLYSFLLTYKLGLEVTNSKKFIELKKIYMNENKLKRLNTMSPNFLYFCSKDSAFESLNNNDYMLEFLDLYFSIGNVIPIWPGGNKARGMKGIYDIPEIFFNMYPLWRDELIRQYDNTIFLDDVVKESRYENTLKDYPGLFMSINRLKKAISENNQIYNDYLCHRNSVIRSREQKITEYIKSNNLQ